jgi:hypothetical protein
MRKPTVRMQSVSDQATEKADATTDLTVSERPLNDFLAEVSERTDVRVGVPLPRSRHAGNTQLEMASGRNLGRAQLTMDERDQA